MTFRTALTGLNAATSDLNVVANNIANSSTAGFKSSRAEFAEFVTRGISAAAVDQSDGAGAGVQVSTVTQKLQQGGISYTGRPLDLAISGQGFFVLNDNGTTIYSRAGNFQMDREGRIVNSFNHVLTGFQADSSGNVTNTLGDLRLSTADLPPQTTTEVEMGVNLDATSELPVVAPFDYTDPDTYNFSTSLSIFDSQGSPHSMVTYFTKSGPNAWDLAVSVDGTTPAHATLSSTALNFTTGGDIDLTASPQPITVDVDMAAVAADLGLPTGSASPLSFELSLADSTQFGGVNGTNTLVQDGFASGRLAGVDIDSSGVLFGMYSNGQSRALGQVSLANFSNPQGLGNIGDTAWMETFASGAPLVGSPNTGSLGALQAASIEESNVELTEELVNMITAQRNFQANAQVISTADSLTQTIINLR
jgi:flagellar hook protein FlgE